MMKKQIRTDSRTVLLYILFLTVFGFGVFAPVAAAAAPEAYFISMYKDFFNNVEQRRFWNAWDVQTVASKMWVAKEIADAAIQMKKNVTTGQVYDMLETDKQNVRTNFFNNLNDEWQKSSFLTDIKKAQYAVKSMTKERVVLVITIGNDAKDFQILQEQGRWKLNFFDDIAR